MVEMQPVTKENLERSIEEGKAAGKDVSGLEAALDGENYSPLQRVPMGETRRVGGAEIISTGPAREEDFNK
jgi:hypothetical protein